MSNQKGNIIFIILGIIAIAIVAGGVGYFVAKKPSQKEESKEQARTYQQQIQQEQQKSISEITEQKTQQVNGSPESEIPKITFERKTSGLECYAGINPIFNVIKNGIIIGSVEGANCDSNNGIILVQNQQYAYFSIPPSGLGGYILFHIYSNLYQLDLTSNNISKIINKGFNDNDFSFDLKKVIYNDTSLTVQRIVLFDLLNKTIIKTYQNPEGYSQFGEFKFSPDDNKVAFVAVYGPDNEKSAVYVLYLSDGKLEKVAEKNDYIFKILGWSSEGTVTYK